MQSYPNLPIKEDPLGALLRGEVSWIHQTPDGSFDATDARPGCLLAGSFNPLHVGHIRMATLIRERWGVGVDFEISVANVDKPMLSREVIEHRAKQFVEKARLYLTVAPTFLEKARLFPHCVFLIGADTAIRILDPKYYDHNEQKRNDALDEIRSLYGSFQVFGRSLEGVFHTGESLNIPERFTDLFIYLSEDDFREDISSTEIRKSGELRVGS